MNINDIIEAIRLNRIRITDHADEEAQADQLKYDEIYFSVPVEADIENPRTVVDLGDIAYWPPGSAFCIFFGKTPMSKGNEIRPASEVNVFGKIEGDPKVFKMVKMGDKVTIEEL